MKESHERTQSASWTVLTTGLILGVLLGAADVFVQSWRCMYEGVPAGQDPWGRPLSWSAEVLLALPRWGWMVMAGAAVAVGLLGARALRGRRLTHREYSQLNPIIFLIFALLIGYVVISFSRPLLRPLY